MNKFREKVLGFLKAKGLLIAPDITPMPSIKLDAQEVYEFALKYEPRVLEVFPAALIHFPSTFLHRKKFT